MTPNSADCWDSGNSAYGVVTRDAGCLLARDSRPEWFSHTPMWGSTLCTLAITWRSEARNSSQTAEWTVPETAWGASPSPCALLASSGSFHVSFPGNLMLSMGWTQLDPGGLPAECCKSFLLRVRLRRTFIFHGYIVE